MFLIDLDELEILNSKLKLFSYNKFGMFKFSDKDYLTQNKLTTFQNVTNWLKKYELSNSVSKIYCLTTVRFLNHTFNPITIYYILDFTNKIICHIAEVNNTFGDGHVLLQQQSIIRREFSMWRAFRYDFGSLCLTYIACPFHF